MADAKPHTMSGKQSEARAAITGDITFDPTYRQQRHVARYLVGLLLNELRGVRPMFSNYTRAMVLEQAEQVGRQFGIIAPPDELHHAPACPANLWSGQALPQAPCSCGAESDARSALRKASGEG